MNSFRFGPLFMAKMTLFLALVALIALHAAWLGPRIQRALEAAETAGSEELASLRRRSLWVSAAMVAVSLAVLALGVAMGHHEYAYLAR